MPFGPLSLVPLPLGTHLCPFPIPGHLLLCYVLRPGTAGEMEGGGAAPGLIWEGRWDGGSPGPTFLSHPQVQSRLAYLLHTGSGDAAALEFLHDSH